MSSTLFHGPPECACGCDENEDCLTDVCRIVQRTGFSRFKAYEFADTYTYQWHYDYAARQDPITYPDPPHWEKVIDDDGWVGSGNFTAGQYVKEKSTDFGWEEFAGSYHLESDAVCGGYPTDDAVLGCRIYLCIDDVTGSARPSTDPDHWQDVTGDLVANNGVLDSFFLSLTDPQFKQWYVADYLSGAFTGAGGAGPPPATIQPGQIIRHGDATGGPYYMRCLTSVDTSGDPDPLDTPESWQYFPYQRYLEQESSEPVSYLTWSETNTMTVHRDTGISITGGAFFEMSYSVAPDYTVTFSSPESDVVFEFATDVQLDNSPVDHICSEIEVTDTFTSSAKVAMAWPNYEFVQYVDGGGDVTLGTLPGSFVLTDVTLGNTQMLFHWRWRFISLWLCCPTTPGTPGDCGGIDACTTVNVTADIDLAIVQEVDLSDEETDEMICEEAVAQVTAASFPGTCGGLGLAYTTVTPLYTESCKTRILNRSGDPYSVTVGASCSTDTGDNTYGPHECGDTDTTQVVPGGSC